MRKPRAGRGVSFLLTINKVLLVLANNNASLKFESKVRKWHFCNGNSYLITIQKKEDDEVKLESQIREQRGGWRQ